MLGKRICVGTRFKNRTPRTNVTSDTYAEFFTDHDGKFLFSFPLPIHTDWKSTSQINIYHIESAWHRKPPLLMPKLSKPRRPRTKDQP